MAELEAALGYTFTDPELLRRALTHRSLEAEDSRQVSNERLEFLGDAVLGLVVAHELFGAGDLSEGSMAKVRAAVVDVMALADIAREIDLGSHLRLGKGETASGGSDKDSILADAMEAVIGAMYVDGGLEAARSFIRTRWSSRIAERAAAPGQRDYKTRLQEELARDGRIPEYEVEGSGPDHDRRYRAEVVVDESVIGTGEGTSKKRAEQEAARVALRSLSDA
jgi:ribonuclease-3